MSVLDRIHDLQDRALRVSSTTRELSGQHRMGSAEWCNVYDRGNRILHRIANQIRATAERRQTKS